MSTETEEKKLRDNYHIQYLFDDLKIYLTELTVVLIYPIYRKFNLDFFDDCLEQISRFSYSNTQMLPN